MRGTSYELFDLLFGRARAAMGGEIEDGRKRKKDNSDRNKQDTKKSCRKVSSEASMPRFGRDGRSGKRKERADDDDESLQKDARGRKDGDYSAGATGPLLIRGGSSNIKRKKREEHDGESSQEDAPGSRSLKTKRTYGGNDAKNYSAGATGPLCIGGANYEPPRPSGNTRSGGTAVRRGSQHLSLPNSTRIGVPGPELEKQENDVSVIVVAPGCHQADEFGEAIKLVLFGPRAPTGTQSHRAYLSAPAPQPQAVTTAIVHIRGSYGSYLSRHKQGMAAQARLVTPQDTFFHNLWNRGIIKQAVADLLEPQRPSLAKCSDCRNPAEWIASCCGLKLCSYCIPHSFIQKHDTASRRPCRALGAIGILNPPTQYTPDASYRAEDDMVCTRQMILQIEDEENRRTRLRDIFVVRSVLPLADIWSRKHIPRRYTYFYHLRWDGNLTFVFRIDEELSFLKYSQS